MVIDSIFPVLQNSQLKKNNDCFINFCRNIVQNRLKAKKKEMKEVPRDKKRFPEIERDPSSEKRKVRGK